MISDRPGNSSLSVNKVGRPQGRRREQTRKNLLQCARTSFNEYGYGGATFSDVAKRAGLTSSALYTHFATKAELYTATLEYTYAPMLPRFQQALAQESSFKEKLRAILMIAVDAHENDRESTIFLVASQIEMTRYPELRDDKDGFHRVMRTTLEEIFQQAIDKGEIPAHLSTGDLLTTFIGGAMGMASYEVCMKSGSMRVAVETLLGLLHWN